MREKRKIKKGKKEIDKEERERDRGGGGGESAKERNRRELLACSSLIFIDVCTENNRVKMLFHQ